MKKTILYKDLRKKDPPYTLLSRITGMILLLTVSLMHAQSPGGVSGAALWLRADAGTNAVTYYNVPSGSRTASNSWSGLGPENSTLASSSSWSASSANTGASLTLDLGSVQPVYGVVTKGRGDAAQWVTAYTISYSSDNTNFTSLGSFTGNTDQNTEVINYFSSSVNARYIRFTETNFSTHPSMRADVVQSVTSATDGSAVVQWKDQSTAAPKDAAGYGNSNVRPTYKASGTNFNPSIALATSSAQYFQVAPGFADFTAGTTVYVVAKPKTAANYARFIDFGNGEANNNLLFNRTGTSQDLDLTSVIANSASGSNIRATNGIVNDITSIYGGFIAGAAATANVTGSIYRNGTQLLSGNIRVPNNITRNSNYIGRSSWSVDSYYDGDFSEVIIYQGNQSSARNRIESYLAIKYGVTLSSDYTLSDGSTTVWSSSGNTGYNNNIAGIGRDDNSALSQKQSRSVNSGIQPVIGNGTISATNAGNTNSFSADKSAMVWGSDTGSSSFATAFAFGTSNYRMARIWKVQETGTVGTVKVGVKASDLPGNVTQPVLVVSSDTTFNGSDTILSLTSETIGGETYYTATTDLTSGQYFTFAAFVNAPGGIVPGLTAWYKENAGNTGTIWKNAANFSDAAGTGTNVYNTSGADLINFNASYTFNTSGVFTLPPALDLSGSFTLTGVARLKTAGSNGRVFGSVAGLNNQLFGYWGNKMNTVYYDGTPDNLNTAIPSTTDVRAYTYLRNGGPYSFYGNGVSILSGASSGANAFRGSIGGSYASNENSNVIVPEFVTYSAALSPTDLSKVESYLALKYGYTKAGNYLLSSGTTAWDATTVTTYNNNIAGIARDDASALSQKQSRSVNSGIQPVIGNVTISDTNAGNTNSFSADKSAMVWGSDTGSTLFTSSFQYGTSNYRMARIWKVQETGTVGQVKVAVKASDVPGSITRPVLVVSSDTTFDGNDAILSLTSETIGGETYYTATTDFTSGQYFTFAGFVTAPGGVVSETLWLKADADTGTTTDGAPVAQWKDQSMGLSHATGNGNSSTKPSYKISGTNFNPSIALATGSAQYFQVPSGFADFMAGTTVYVVAKPKTAANYARFIDFGNGEANNNLLFNRIGTSQDLNFASYIGNSNSAITATGGIVNDITSIYGGFIASGIQAANVTGSIYRNGTQLLSGNIRVPNNITRNFNYIGRSSWNVDSYYDGDFSEVIIYQGNQSSARNRIESYLAIKYGVTLSSDYTLSDGSTTVWNSLGNTGYNNNIAGIARDDASALSQKQSQSVNSGIQPVIGNGTISATNAGNANSFGADKTAMVWGSDTGNTSFATAFATATTNYRMARIWKVQQTGTVGQVKVALKANDLRGIINPVLVVSTDAIVDTSDQKNAMVQETIGGVTYYTAMANLSSGNYFTFAGLVTAPGGVLGEAMWVKADTGTSTTADNTAISSWADQSTNGTDALQNTAANQPLFRNDASQTMNFNPVVNFDGSNDFMDAASAVSGSTNTLFSAIRPTLTANNGIDVLGFGSGIGSQQGGEFRLVNNAALQYLQMNGNGTQASVTSPSNSYIGGMSLLYGSTINNGAVKIFQNHSTVQTANISTTPPLGSVVSIGSRTLLARDLYFYGAIPEIVTYNSVLSDIDRLRVNSYFALKYGITISRETNGNTTPGETISGSIREGDYIASDGSTKFWNSDTAYQNNIAGIARDDNSALSQKQSQSVNSGFQPVIGNGTISATNAGNTNSFSADKTAMVWGSDTGSASFATAFAFGTSNYRMARIWKVQETGTVGQVKVAIKASDLGASVTKPVLVVSPDTTFDGSDAILSLTPETIGTVQYYTTTTDFSSGDHFTFAAYVTAPGGVINETLWLKADADTGTTTDGTPVAQWKDQSMGLNHATGNGNSSTKPSYKISGTNFNPSIALATGSAQYFQVPPGFADFTVGTTVYVVAKPKNTPSFARFIDFSNGSNGGSDNLIFNRNNTSSNLDLHVYTGTSTDNYVQAANGIVNDITSVYGGFIAAGNAGSTAAGSIFRNGTQLAITGGTGTKVPNNLVRYNNYIGRSSWNIDSYYDGDFSEVIIYQGDKSTVRNRIESYLAIKYGITLSSDYIFSDGSTTAWSSSGNTGYNNNIAGIGRDDASALLQKQSQSVNSGIQPVIGNETISDTNANNTNTFNADKSAMVWGSDTGSTSFATSFQSGNSNYRMTRIWKVQETGTVGTVKVALKASDVPGNLTSLTLLVNGSSTFDNSAAQTPMTQETVGNITYYTATANFTSGQYFTFAGIVTAPGGVISGLDLWVKGDKGFSAGQWQDQSQGARVYLQSNAANQPSTGIMNFNTAAKFDGNDLMDISSSLSTLLNGSINSSHTQITAFNSNTTSNVGISDIYSSCGGNGDLIWNTFGNLWMDQGCGNVQPNYGGSTAVSQNLSYLNTYTYANPSGQMFTYRNNLQTGSGTNSSVPTGFSLARLGYGEIGGYFKGNIGEYILYNKVISSTDRQRIDSYLAIRYGVTLGSTASTISYLGADGTTTYWTGDTTYQNNIAGIGRDDYSGLVQKQSQSVNSGSQPVMSLGDLAADNPSNTGTFAADKQFLVWGDDNGSLTNTVSTGNLTYSTRITRVWKAKNTGSFAGDISVYYPVSIFGTAPASAVSLLYGNTAASLNDGSASASPQNGTVSINGVSYYKFSVSNTQVPNLQYFSFAMKGPFCYKPAATSGTTLDSKYGITALGRAGDVNSDNWPMVRKGAWMVLEAKTKGMVINRLTAAAISAIPAASLVEGMMVYDTTNLCLKIYNGTSWQCYTVQTCPN